MDKTKQRILKAASRLFFNHGFYRVSMDSLVSEVRTSKSTIYKYFPSKEDLVQAVLEDINAKIDNKLDMILADSTLNFHGKLNEVTRFTGKTLAKVSPEFLADLRTQTPDLWDYYQEKRQNRLDNKYLHLFKSGMDEGFVRQDLNPTFLVLIYTKLTELVVHPESLSSMPMSNDNAYDALSLFFLKGALTEKGREQV